MTDTRSLWDLLEDLVQERDNLMVDEEGEIVRLGELDELLAARHVKRLVTQWGNRKRGRGVPRPLPGQTEIPIDGSPDGAEGDERTSTPLVEASQEATPVT